MEFTNDRFLVELLEYRLIQETVKYRHTLDECWETEKYDKSYFSKFISETLMAEFKEWIYSRVNKLNNFEINKFLSLSIEQFNTHKPDNRKKALEEMYHLVYWYPNAVPDKKLSPYDKNFLYAAIRAYERFYSTFQNVAEKTLIDFKAGLIGANTTFQSVSPSEQTKEKISFRDFKNFLKHLEYNYPYKIDVMTFKYFMRDVIDYLKKEILENFINITTEEKIAYLDRIRYEIETYKKNVWATYDDIKIWLEKYNITEEEIFSHQKFSNELYRLLSEEPPTFKETFEPDFNKDTEQVQSSFYNYYYGQALIQILDYITEHEAKINPLNQTKQPQYKMKTKLTVPQLSYLFRALNDNKLIDITNKTDLFKFIADSFQTKASDDISWQSVKNKFDTPEFKAVEFWDEKFLHLRQSTIKDKENI